MIIFIFQAQFGPNLMMHLPGDQPGQPGPQPGQPGPAQALHYPHYYDSHNIPYPPPK